jgi:hypothetical protein
MAKRRLISLLQTYNQTDDLKDFFGSTVDQVFQPGTSEPISGYIGDIHPRTTRKTSSSANPPRRERPINSKPA